MSLKQFIPVIALNFDPKNNCDKGTTWALKTHHLDGRAENIQFQALAFWGPFFQWRGFYFINVSIIVGEFFFALKTRHHAPTGLICLQATQNLNSFVSCRRITKPLWKPNFLMCVVFFNRLGGLCRHWTFMKNQVATVVPVKMPQNKIYFSENFQSFFRF